MSVFEFEENKVTPDTAEDCDCDTVSDGNDGDDIHNRENKDCDWDCDWDCCDSEPLEQKREGVDSELDSESVEDEDEEMDLKGCVLEGE